MHVTPPAAPTGLSLMTNNVTAVYRITSAVETNLIPNERAGITFDSVEQALAHATKYTAGAQEGAVALVDAGQGAVSVQPLALSTRTAYGSGLDPKPTGPAKLSAFHTEGELPSWTTSRGGPLGMYGHETTSAAARLLGVVDGDTVFHVANGGVQQGLRPTA